MNHGVAILKEDWDIFKKNDMFIITGCLPEHGVSIATWGQRGCSVPLLAWESIDDFKKLFEMHLYSDKENCKWVAETEGNKLTFYEVEF